MENRLAWSHMQVPHSSHLRVSPKAEKSWGVGSAWMDSEEAAFFISTGAAHKLSKQKIRRGKRRKRWGHTLPWTADPCADLKVSGWPFPEVKVKTTLQASSGCREKHPHARKSNNDGSALQQRRAKTFPAHWVWETAKAGRSNNPG